MTENIAEFLVVIFTPFSGAIIGIVLVAIMVFAIFSFFYGWFDQE